MSRLCRTLRGADGVSLVELLVGMVLTSIVVGATLTMLDVFADGIGRTERRNDTQQQARTSVDRISRQLRNLASPTSGRPEAVDKASAYDLVFQSVDPLGPNAGTNVANVRRLRYCLDTRDPSAGVIWLQSQTWTVLANAPVPATAAL